MNEKRPRYGAMWFFYILTSLNVVLCLYYEWGWAVSNIPRGKTEFELVAVHLLAALVFFIIAEVARVTAENQR